MRGGLEFRVISVAGPATRIKLPIGPVWSPSAGGLGEVDRKRLRRFPGLKARLPALAWDVLEKEFHQHLVVSDVVDDNLPRQPTTLPEAQVSVERLSMRVRGSYVDEEFPVFRLTRKGQGHVPKLTAQALPPPLRKKKGTDLTNMSH